MQEWRNSYRQKQQNREAEFLGSLIHQLRIDSGIPIGETIGIKPMVLK